MVVWEMMTTFGLGMAILGFALYPIDEAPFELIGGILGSTWFVGGIMKILYTHDKVAALYVGFSFIWTALFCYINRENILGGK